MMTGRGRRSRVGGSGIEYHQSISPAPHKSAEEAAVVLVGISVIYVAGESHTYSPSVIGGGIVRKYISTG